MIRLERVTRLYGDHPAVDDVTLHVPRGQFLALMGHNGAGKSTLLRILAGLTRPTEGRVLVSGKELRKETSARAALGLLAHESYLYGPLTARENLQLFARLYRVPNRDERLDQILSDVGLEWAADLPIDSFSRGMEQRAALARVLLHDPKVLLLDEPFAGLDRAAETFLDGQLRRLRAAEKTAILVTHDPARAVRSADRIVVLRRGRIAYDEPADSESVESFADTYAGLLGEGTS